MDDHRMVLSPRLLNDLSFAYRMDLGHDVQLTQATPTRVFVGRGIQLVFVSAVNGPHMSQPIFQRAAPTILEARRALRRNRNGRRR